MSGKRVSSGTIDILNKDNPTKQEMKKALDQFFFQRPSGLVLPKDYERLCGGCGTPLARTETVIYCKEEFCKKCVETWTQGGVR